MVSCNGKALICLHLLVLIDFVMKFLYCQKMPKKEIVKSDSLEFCMEIMKFGLLFKLALLTHG